jgi:transaldolase
MKIKLFADGAVISEMLDFYRSGKIQGFTTNPTLMRKAGITDYEKFASDVLEHIRDLPISFEVFSDEFAEMERQALKLSSLGDNVYVKIPITNTKKESSLDLVNRLSSKGVRLNVTAIMTEQQVYELCSALTPNVPSVVSVFAGRVADTGIDPIPVMKQCLSYVADVPEAELLWASPREVLNVYQAENIGCHIITATTPILNKLKLYKKDLNEYSLDTVKMFYQDAQLAGYKL